MTAFLLVCRTTFKTHTVKRAVNGARKHIYQNVKPTSTVAGDKHSDGGGMHLLVDKGGNTGVWTTVTLTSAKRLRWACILPSRLPRRQRRDKARELLADGIAPSIAKREDKQTAAMAAANTVELVAREFHQSKAETCHPAMLKSGFAAWSRTCSLPLEPFPSPASMHGPADRGAQS
jgi:hypothetical protein